MTDTFVGLAKGPALGTMPREMGGKGTLFRGCVGAQLPSTLPPVGAMGRSIVKLQTYGISVETTKALTHVEHIALV